MFALDIDPAQEVSMTFQKRGRGFAGMSFLINPAIEIPAIAFPNIVTFSESSTTYRQRYNHIRLYDNGGQTKCIQIPTHGFQREIFRAVHIDFIFLYL